MQAGAALADVVRRFTSTAERPEEALGSFVAGLQERGHGWYYHATGCSFVSAHAARDGVFLLEPMLALGLADGRPWGAIPVDCRALARLTACAAAHLGLGAFPVQLTDDGRFLRGAALGTNRVLPLGAERWRHPTVTGTLGMHEIVVVGDRHRRDTWRVYDPSFRLDASEDPVIRPHVAATVAGWPLDRYLRALVPEVAVGAWDLADHPDWPRAWPVDLVLPTDEPTWIRAPGEAAADFLRRVRDEAPAWAVDLVNRERADPVGIVAPDELRVVLFARSAERRVWMRTRYRRR